MALFKIFGNFASGNTTLPTSATQGFCYFDKNTGKFYIDTTNAVSGRMALNAEKETQQNQNASEDYRILLSGNANDTTEIAYINKNTNLRFNPGTQLLSVGGSISATGDLTITGVTQLNGQAYANSLTAGSLIVNGNTNFVQIPTAPTPASDSNDTSVATTAFVMNAFTANDAMVFKGVVNANGDLPTTHKQGWTYRVATAGTYAGKVCEVGDMIVCVTDGTAANNDHWAVIQNNVDGAVYRGTNSFTDANIIIADSTAGKVKSSGKTITNTAPSASSTSATIPSSTAVWAAISGASGYGKTGTVTSVQVQATSPVVSSSSASASTSLSTTISLADGYGDTKNPYVAKTANYVLAGPSSGTATAVPTFRALVAADIPSITKSKISDFPTSMPASDVSAWAKAANKPSYTYSEVGAAAASHTHGNLTNDGKISTTATIASGDKLVIVDTDSTAASKITGSSITFGTSTTTFLSNKGTWETPAGTYSLPLAASGTRGGIQIGYSESGTNYAVKLSSEKAYVTVPWTDTKQNTTLATTSKAYLTGVTTTPTSTTQALAAVADTGVYLTTTAGQLAAKSVMIVGSANSTNIITSDATNNIYVQVNNKIPLVIADTVVRSGNGVKGTINLGAADNKWNNVYANYFYGDGSNLTNLPVPTIIFKDWTVN